MPQSPLVTKLIKAFDQEYGEDRCGWAEVTKEIDGQVIRAIATDIKKKISEVNANYISYNQLMHLLILTYKLTEEKAEEFYQVIMQAAGMLEFWDYAQTNQPYYITTVNIPLKHPFEA